MKKYRKYLSVITSAFMTATNDFGKESEINRDSFKPIRKAFLEM